jgi:hypothetical protein
MGVPAMGVGTIILVVVSVDFAPVWLTRAEQAPQGDLKMPRFLWQLEETWFRHDQRRSLSHSP